MPLFPNYIGACPYFKTRFYQNQVMSDQTIKNKKKMHGTRVKGDRVLKRHYRA